MAAVYGSGLSSVEIGAIDATGAMGTVLLPIGNTVQGSMKLTSAEGTSQKFNIEEQDNPVKEIITPGATELAWECYDISGENMAKLFGGSYDSGTKIYTAPDKVVAQEYSVKLVSADGPTMKIVRMSVFPTFNWDFTKDGMAKVALKGTILQPTLAGTKPYTIDYN